MSSFSVTGAVQVRAVLRRAFAVCLLVSGTLVANPVTAADAGPNPARDEESTRAYFTDLPLVNSRGEELRFYSDVLKGRVVAINFIYTTCGEACPIIMYRLTEVRDALGERFGKDIFFVSISVDPNTDTPQAMADFARNNEADQAGWIYLTGDRRNIDAIITRLGQYRSTVEAHSTLILAGNVPARRWARIQAHLSPQAIAEKLRQLADSG